MEHICFLKDRFFYSLSKILLNLLLLLSCLTKIVYTFSYSYFRQSAFKELSQTASIYDWLPSDVKCDISEHITRYLK